MVRPNSQAVWAVGTGLQGVAKQHSDVDPLLSKVTCKSRVQIHGVVCFSQWLCIFTRFLRGSLISPKKVQTTIIREYKTSEQNASKALTSQRQDKGVLVGPSTDKKTDAKLLGKKPPSDGEVLAAKGERSGQAQELPPS